MIWVAPSERQTAMRGHESKFTGCPLLWMNVFCVSPTGASALAMRAFSAASSALPQLPRMYQQLVAAVNETREKLKRELENALTR